MSLWNARIRLNIHRSVRCEGVAPQDAAFLQSVFACPEPQAYVFTETDLASWREPSECTRLGERVNGGRLQQRLREIRCLFLLCEVRKDTVTPAANARSLEDSFPEGASERLN